MTALFTYRRGTTIVHKAPPILKLAILLALSITVNSSIANLSDWIVLTAYSVLAFLFFILSKTPLNHLKKLNFIIFMGLFVTFFRVVRFAPFSADFAQIPHGILYTARFFIATVFVLIFFETTSTSQITDSFQKIQDIIATIFPPFKKFFYKHNPARIMGLAIGFIPRVFATWEKVRLASLARTHIKKQNRVKNFIFIIEVQFSALLSCMINVAETTRKAVINRSEDL